MMRDAGLATYFFMSTTRDENICEDRDEKQVEKIADWEIESKFFIANAVMFGFRNSAARSFLSHRSS